ncbi:DMT family transporter [Paenibacillus physcomitrellae]|uniref:Membrane protein YvaE n=1 Tax=Paenibacillus physcomitrellae TaxID=1619311 RepID=A0ABQ1GRC1_9BACL|nr:multidrug efflux SMR transporter [Paenibacillus physcomitrellae]GGA48461.1 putative membrane protein YvaE [Paenibacillus physcomitrellae]
MGWLFLLLAIVLELSGTLSMKLSNGFARWIPSMLMFIFYGASFTFLNYALKYMKISIVYATWSGIGIVLISLAGVIVFQEKLPLSAMLWIIIIVVGIVGLNMSIKGG